MKTMGRKGKIIVILLAALIVACSGMALAADSVGPLEQIKETVDKAIFVLQDEALLQPEMREERRRQVVALVEERFDYEEMSKRSLARYWKERTSAERAQFVGLFKRVLENTYIDRVDTYSGEKVDFVRQEIQGDKAMVESSFVSSDKQIPVFYKLRNNSGNWLVYDVIIEGVSLVRNYRTQFESIIEKEKYPGLVAKLEEKAAKGGSFEETDGTSKQ